MDIIELTPTSRLNVEPEQYAECPRGDWHMLTGFVKIDGRGDSRLSDVPAVHDDTLGIESAYDEFWNITSADPEDVTVRWARIFHGLYIEYDSKHGGFWFVAGADAATAQTPVDEANRALFYDNWPDLKVGTLEHLAKQREVIQNERKVYDQWASGDVYTVTLERKETYVKVAPFKNYAGETVVAFTGMDDSITQWEAVDGIGHCYLDDDYSVYDVAHGFFNLSPEEQAVVNENIKTTEMA